MHGSNSFEKPLKMKKIHNLFLYFFHNANFFHLASKCHKTILLKIDRRVSSLNSSTEIILKCRKKRGVTLRPERRGESIEHIIYTQKKKMEMWMSYI